MNSLSTILNVGYFIITILIIIYTIFSIWLSSTQIIRKKVKDERRIRKIDKENDPIKIFYEDKSFYQIESKKVRNGKQRTNISTMCNYLWRKHYRGMILILTIFITWIALYVDNFMSIEDIPPKDELSALMIIITTAAIFWYSREAYDQKQTLSDTKKIAKEQVELTKKQIKIQEQYDIEQTHKGR